MASVSTELQTLVPLHYMQPANVVTNIWCNCSPGLLREISRVFEMSIVSRQKPRADVASRLVRSRADPSLNDLSGLTAFVPTSSSPLCGCMSRYEPLRAWSRLVTSVTSVTQGFAATSWPF